MTTKHTPGPWKVVQQNHRMRVTTDYPPTEHGYASGHRWITPDWYEQKSGWPPVDVANARLIAVAPELYEVLRIAVLANDHTTGNSDEPGWLDGAKTALAKAQPKTTP